MLPDAGMPQTIAATFGTCGTFNPCAGNLAGTWFRSAVCIEPTNPFGTFCPGGSLLSYTGTSTGRLDFLGQDLVRTFSSDETLIANFPVECLTLVSTCTQLETLLTQSGLTGSCPTATGGRTGCDCTVVRTNPQSSTTTTWTDNGGGLITINDGANPFQWRTCVLTGNPDVLYVTGSDGVGRQTYQRR